MKQKKNLLKVSVVIPVYNEEKYIANCLESLTQQEEKPDEIIVVNNNCRDQTISIAKNFPIRVINEKKQGMIPARNTGFEAARYTLIARCDADSVLPSNWIKTIKHTFKTQSIDALSGPLYMYDILDLAKDFNVQVITNLAGFFKAVKGHAALSGPNMALTKDIWERVKNELCTDETQFHEDMDLAIHIHHIGGKIRYDNDLLVGTSARRMKHNLYSMYVDYPIRGIKTLLHQP